MHEPGRHADDCTTRHKIAVECGARVWDHPGESADDAEGKAESFFDTAGLSSSPNYVLKIVGLSSANFSVCMRFFTSSTCFTPSCCMLMTMLNGSDRYGASHGGILSAAACRLGNCWKAQSAGPTPRIV